jgi:hypothetical protein
VDTSSGEGEVIILSQMFSDTFFRRSSLSQYSPSALKSNRRLIPVAEYFKSLSLPLDVLHIVLQDSWSTSLRDNFISEADSLPAMVLISLTSSVLSGSVSLELKVCEDRGNSLLFRVIFYAFCRVILRLEHLGPRTVHI